MHPRIARCAASEAVRKPGHHLFACGRDIGPAGEPEATRAGVFARWTTGATDFGGARGLAPQ